MAARAQQVAQMRRIGVLFGSLDEGYVSALRQGLLPLGWIEGRNLQIDIREARGDARKMGDYAKELILKSPDVIAN